MNVPKIVQSMKWSLITMKIINVNKVLYRSSMGLGRIYYQLLDTINYSRPRVSRNREVSYTTLHHSERKSFSGWMHTIHIIRGGQDGWFGQGAIASSCTNMSDSDETFIVAFIHGIAYCKVWTVIIAYTCKGIYKLNKLNNWHTLHRRWNQVLWGGDEPWHNYDSSTMEINKFWVFQPGGVEGHFVHANMYK